MNHDRKKFISNLLLIISAIGIAGIYIRRDSKSIMIQLAIISLATFLISILIKKSNKTCDTMTQGNERNK